MKLIMLIQLFFFFLNHLQQNNYIHIEMKGLTVTFMSKVDKSLLKISLNER